MPNFNDYSRQGPDSFRRTTNTAQSSSSGVGFTSSDLDQSLDNIRKFYDKVVDLNKSATRKILQNSFRSASKDQKWDEDRAKKLIKQSTSFTKNISNAFGKTIPGKFISSISEYNKAINKINSGTAGIDYKKLANQAVSAAGKMGEAVSAAIEKLTQQVVKYAQAYESHLTSTSVGLNINRSQYSSLLQGANTQVFSSGLGSSVSMSEVMTGMDKLVSQGIASNLETLSTLEAASDLISTTFDSSQILYQMRRFGSSSGIYEYSLAMEGMLRDTLQEQFGDSQYISSGMYNTTRQMLQSLWASQETAEESAELQYAMQTGIGTLVEMGASEQTATSLVSILQEFSTKGYSDNPLAYMIASQAGLNPMDLWSQNINEDNIGSYYEGFVKVLESIQTDNQIVAGIWSELLGISTEDIVNGTISYDDFVKAYGEANESASSEDMFKYLDEEIANSSDSLTIQKNIANSVENIVGLLGVNTVAQVGSGIINGAGSILSAVAGFGATKMLSSALGGSGGGLGKLSKLVSGGASGLTSASAATSGMKTVPGAKMLSGGASVPTKMGGLLVKSGGVGNIKGWNYSTGAKVLGGVGGAISGISDASSAMSNNTYSDNDILNGIGGFFMGDQTGFSDAGGAVLGILGNTAKGAALGSIFGPIGTAIGAGIGLLGGIIGNAIADSRKDSLSSAEAASTTTSDSMSSLMKDIKTSIDSQTDKVLAALSNMYTMINNNFNSLSGRVTAEGTYAS